MPSEPPNLRLELIGHACLGIEAAGRRILVDPWLGGSCYWRSWWHYPGPPAVAETWLAPDLVYLSHHHFDHFHYPSMRRLSRDATVLVPRFGVDVLAGELEELGFRRVVELAHGAVHDLGDGLRVASYQHGFDDSALVVAAGSTVVVDLNDCKLRGRALQQVVDDFGDPTFMLRTHSWAQSYPLLYEADDDADLSLVTDETFLRDFSDAAAQLQPRYAVPFANMVAFLHPQAQAANEHLITPERVRAHCAADPRLSGVEFVAMGPGDSWSEAGGFSPPGPAWWEDRAPTLAALEAAAAPTLARVAEEEAAVQLPFAVMRAYLEELAASIWWPVRRAFFRRPIVFAAPWDQDCPWWVLDMRRGTLRRRRVQPADAASTIWIDEAVLADAIEKRILHMVHGSMRIRAHLRPGGASEDLGFWGLLMIFEIGYLPLRRLPLGRFTGVLVRRWREALDMVAGLAGRGKGSPLERLAGGFASSGSATSPRE